jgi:hypothetical protein
LWGFTSSALDAFGARSCSACANGVAGRREHAHAELRETSCEHMRPIAAAAREAGFDLDVAALDEALLRALFTQRRDVESVALRPGAVARADHREASLRP